jgi:hypothetical protein
VDGPAAESNKSKRAQARDRAKAEKKAAQERSQQALLQAKAANRRMIAQKLDLLAQASGIAAPPTAAAVAVAGADGALKAESHREKKRKKDKKKKKRKDGDGEFDDQTAAAAAATGDAEAEAEAEAEAGADGTGEDAGGEGAGAAANAADPESSRKARLFALLQDELTRDYDPEALGKRMAELFGDDYYNEQDPMTGAACGEEETVKEIIGSRITSPHSRRIASHPVRNLAC